MNCDECKQNPATVQFTQVVNGELQQINLCAECVAQKSMQFFGMAHPFSLPNLFGSMFGINQAKPTFQLPAESQTPCPSCGVTLTDIHQNGKLGCGECYSQFQSELASLIGRIHGNARHVGKLPSRLEGPVRLKKEIERLKESLQEAISAEQYEQAAEIRDSIKDLEAQVKE